MIDTINDWELLRFFLAVGKTGSFSAAAESLAASHPTVSRKIDLLEAKVGTKLLLRSSTGVHLTDAGRGVLRVAEQIQGMVRSIQPQSPTTELAGTIHFAGSDGIIGYWLPYMMRDFFPAQPGITVKLECTDLRAVPDLSRREADLAVLYREPTDPNVVALIRGEVALGFCASRGYCERHDVPETFEQVLDHPFLAHESYFLSEGPWARIAEMLKRHKRIPIRSNGYLPLVWPLTNGLGVSVMPLSAIEREPDLRFFDVEGWTLQLPFWVCCHREVKDYPPVRALIEHLREPIRRWSSHTLADVLDIKSDQTPTLLKS